MSGRGGHALITGAANGIGAEIAREWRRRSAALRLTLVDVDADGAARVAAEVGGDVVTRRWDLSEPEGLGARYRALEADRGPVDELVNCAGIIDVRTVAGTPWETGRRVLDVDLVSPMRLMSLALPGMVSRGQGVVVNIASMAARTPLRGCAYYGGAKAGLAMASEIARLEVRAKGVRVVTVYPGPIRSALEQGARRQLPQGIALRFLPTGEAAPLAREIADAVEEDRARVVFPPIYRLGNLAIQLSTAITSRFSPDPLA